ncbi:glycosyltransferase family 4 protein [Methanolobus sediminis]|uniref:Glycosyltransferase family 4 protein n=1 Tax=Methanolobus sediminis TaxID=3072978 RepID=A0AA51UIT5_9EURY|nr:glycosyltransferase family 4 protein [Methanolobus sediminis]WMW24307.1 glycosyltransferase family 4 protein [Methanolobus sediminis]
MKILHTVEFYHPSVGGAQEVVRQLSERLAQLGHDVTVATTRLPERDFTIFNGVKIKDFSISGNAVRGFSGEIERYKEFILESDFDVIMNYAAQQWTTDLMLPMLDKIPSKKVLVPCGFSGLYSSEYREYYEQMKIWLKKYDACVYLSNDYRDINFAKKNGVDNKSIIIPNGAGEDEFSKKVNIDIRAKLKIPHNHFLLLHVGSHTGLKGHREAITIFKKSNIKDATLLIVANDINVRCTLNCHLAEITNHFCKLLHFTDKHIIVKFLSREETVAAYHEADLFLFPSNIECSPLVLFEAMASKTPFLTTDVGNAKEIIDWSNGGELLPTLQYLNGYVKADINASIDVLQNLFYNPQKRQNLAINGYKKWILSFTWEKITRDYENLYFNVLNDGWNEL